MEKAVTGGKPPVQFNYSTIYIKRERGMIFVRLCKYGGGWSSIICLISNSPENVLNSIGRRKILIGWKPVKIF